MVRRPFFLILRLFTILLLSRLTRIVDEKWSLEMKVECEGNERTRTSAAKSLCLGQECLTFVIPQRNETVVGDRWILSLCPGKDLFFSEPSDVAQTPCQTPLLVSSVCS